MSEINQLQITVEQKQKALDRAKRFNQKRHTKLQQITKVHQAYLANDPNDVEVGTGTCDIFAVVLYQWVDASLVFSDGTVSFSGSDFVLGAIAAEGEGVATLFVPINQIPSSGQVYVAADAEEAGAAILTFSDNYGNPLCQLTAVLEGAGIDIPIGCSGTYTVTTS